jgi:hypothetical protein
MTMLFIAEDWLTQTKAEIYAAENFSWLRKYTVTRAHPSVALITCINNPPAFIIDMSRDVIFTSLFMNCREQIPSLRDLIFHIGYNGDMIDQHELSVVAEMESGANEYNDRSKEDKSEGIPARESYAVESADDFPVLSKKFQLH